MNPHTNRAALSGLSRVAHLLLGGVLAALAACSTPATLQQKTADWSPNKIYSEARDESASGGYERAIPLYDVLESRTTGTMLAQQAQLDKAYAQYRNGDQAEAIATLDRFIRLNPTSPALDYAMYMKGAIYFNGNIGFLSSLSGQGLTERDQHAIKDAYDAFAALVERFPESRYSADARKRMTYIVNTLAASEVAVAAYYYRRGAYVAAINRAQSAIAQFEATPAQEQALALLAQAYDALGMEQPRDDARRVLSLNYPQSPYLSHKYTGRNSSWWRLW